MKQYVKSMSLIRLLVIMGSLAILTLGIMNHYISKRDTEKQTYYLSETISQLVTQYELEKEMNWQTSTLQSIRFDHPTLISLNITFLDALGDALEVTTQPLTQASTTLIRSGNNLASNVSKETNQLMVSQAIVNQNGRIGIIQVSQSLHDYPYNLSTLKKLLLWLITLLYGLATCAIYILSRHNQQPVKYALSVVEEALTHPENQQELMIAKDEWSLLYDKLNQLMRNNHQLHFQQLVAEEKLEYLLNNVEIGIITVNLETDERTFNAMARDYYYRPNGLKSDIESLLKQLSKSNKRTIAKEIVLDLPTFKVFKAEIRINTTASIQQAEEAIIILYDITSIKILERAHETLIRNVAHELKTPITSIVGFTETILDESLPSDTQKEFIKIIDKEGKRLNQLVNRILELLKTQHQLTEVAIVWKDISEVIKEEMIIYHPLIQAKYLKIDLISSLQSTYEVSEQYFQPIIKNLLENAIHYSIESGDINLKLTETSKSIVFSIQDNGIGIAEVDQQRIFEKFYRVGESRDRKNGGTGLGLSIVQNCVEQLNGQITLESKVNQGATFIVTIPKKNLVRHRSEV
ncbi:sensor histidine kinase [Vagococcus zengguangii]|uniref:sensor histidine kinase n=1 Tax=Vagococcus zengguangii TaxID=2571750 RepID=UPI001108DCA4|nr:HAMP domain-containing sensor histidine kinase [Vagococcus zengguangii]TLG81320.1 HAMP domain-containing histidine kinase [Vagococcus zengguangii]